MSNRPSAASRIVTTSRDRLAPGQLVGVVLVRADEHHRSLAPVKLEHANQRVDRCGRPRPAKDDDVLVTATDRPVDDPASILPQRSRVGPRGRGLGVRVRVQGQHAFADVVLDERQRATGRRVVRIDEPPRTERPLQQHIVANHRLTDPLDRIGGGPQPIVFPRCALERVAVACALGLNGAHRARPPIAITLINYERDHPPVRIRSRREQHLIFSRRAGRVITEGGRLTAGHVDLRERATELEQIERLLADVLAGEGRALLIEGQAGIGKTSSAGGGSAARARSSESAC